MLTLSGAMCAAGGTFYAQKYLYIDPTIAFGIDKSVEMLLVTMVGGAGTIFGPLIGSVVLTGINELTRWAAAVRAGAEERPAAQPDRLWLHADPDRGPPARRAIASLFARNASSAEGRVVLEVRELSKAFGGLKAVDRASLDVARARSSG